MKKIRNSELGCFDMYYYENDELVLIYDGMSFKRIMNTDDSLLNRAHLSIKMYICYECGKSMRLDIAVAARRILMGKSSSCWVHQSCMIDGESIAAVVEDN